MFGLGMAFQQELFPDHEQRLRGQLPEFAAVIYDLSPDGEIELWSAATPDLNNFTRESVSRFFDEYSGGTGEFPTGAGIAIGLRIVQAYLDNQPGATASSLLRIPPEEIFEGTAGSDHDGHHYPTRQSSRSQTEKTTRNPQWRNWTASEN